MHIWPEFIWQLTTYHTRKTWAKNVIFITFSSCYLFKLTIRIIIICFFEKKLFATYSLGGRFDFSKLGISENF